MTVSRSGWSPGSRWNSTTGHRARAARAHEVDVGIERGERDRHVRRMRRDAGLRGAEDREVAVLSFARRAPAARHALVARLADVLEVVAARALQEVAADRREVAKLPRGSLEERGREQRIALAHERIGGQLGIAERRAEEQSALARLLDGAAAGQPPDVDEQSGRLDAEAHEIDEIRAAAEKATVRLPVEQGDGGLGVRGARVVERPHAALSIAATRLT